MKIWCFIYCYLLIIFSALPHPFHAIFTCTFCPFLTVFALDAPALEDDWVAQCGLVLARLELEWEADVTAVGLCEVENALAVGTTESAPQLPDSWDIQRYKYACSQFELSDLQADMFIVTFVPKWHIHHLAVEWRITII